MTTAEKIEKLKEYYSKPENFWPIYWWFMHLCTFMNEDKFTVDKMEEFMEMMQWYLPCITCRGNLWSKLEKFPFTEELWYQENAASKYINTIHNMANIALSKKLIPYEEWIDMMFLNINNKWLKQ